MANNLPKSKQLLVLNLLTEGMGIRAIERAADVSRETVLSLLVRVGEGCARLHDRLFRDLPCTRLELDEQWGFVAKKQRHMRAGDDAQVGDTWLWVAICADTKVVPAFHVGKRTGADAAEFVADLQSRLTQRVQLSTDGLSAYVDSIEQAFGADVDYAQVVKSYEAEPMGPGRYSPPKVSKIDKIVVQGNPDLDLASTSYVERFNLTTRMQVRRMTRLTNAHSKKLRNHRAAPALHIAHYNLVRRHETIRCSPAMEAGVTAELWSMERLLDAALSEAA